MTGVLYDSIRALCWLLRRNRRDSLTDLYSGTAEIGGERRRFAENCELQLQRQLQKMGELQLRAVTVDPAPRQA
jgi:hypothetical protein